MPKQPHTKTVYSECMLRLVVLRVFVFSMCLFLYGPFCHDALFFFEHILTSLGQAWWSLMYV